MYRGGPDLAGVTADPLPSKLKLLWSYKTQGPVKSSAAIVGGARFHRLGRWPCVRVEPGGWESRHGRSKTGGAVESSPLVIGGRVYVGSSDAFLYALNAADGKAHWEVRDRGQDPWGRLIG